MAKTKLELQSLSDQEVVDLLKLVANSLTGNSAFPAPEPGLPVLVADADAMATLMTKRQQLVNEAETVTLAIGDRRKLAEANLTSEAAYVEKVANASTDPEKDADTLIRSAGMGVAEAAKPVGELPKVEGLFATQGDSDCEIDLSWNPIKRGLKSYVIEQSEESAVAGFRMVQVATRSNATVTGLTSGKRYWFRVAGVGSAGQAAFSDPATKVAP